MANFTIGCDPELFVRNRKGKIVSAHGMIPGTKEKPHPVSGGGAVQVDGMAVELNIAPVPLHSAHQFSNGVLKTAAELQNMLPDGHRLCILPFHDFGEEYISTQPEEATELGCDPDFGAWQDGKVNDSPNSKVSFRTAAGHIHLGWGKDIPEQHPDHIEICCKIVKAMDLFLGFHSLLLDPCPKRRELYGKAGAFRPKSYGVEYRTPSNAWLKTMTNRQDVSYMAQKAVRLVTNSTDPQAQLDRSLTDAKNYYGCDNHVGKTVEDIINTSDVEAAKAFFIGIQGQLPFVSKAKTPLLNTGR